MDNMRYKIFATSDGEPLAWTNDITAAVTLLSHFTRADTGDQLPTAALIDKETDRVL